MRVIYIGRYNESEILNGPEKVAKRIFKHTENEEDTIFVEYFFDGNRYGIFKKLFGKEVCVKGKNSVIRLGLISLLFYLIKTRPGIIHIITFERFALICFLYKIFSKSKIIYNVHGIIVYEDSELNKPGNFLRFKNSLCEKVFLKHSDMKVFHSGQSKKFADKYYKFVKQSFCIIPNGADDEFFTASQNRKTNFDEPLKIVFAGDTSRKEKGADFLFSALDEIDFDLLCYIVGNKTGSDFEKNGKAKMHFISKMPSDEFAEFLSDKDVFISASFYENFSMTAIEAMASGLAPVVTQETGMSSIIENGVNGFVYKFGDSHGLIKHLQLLNEDRNKLNEISKNAAKIYSYLNWEKIYCQYRKIYDEYSLSGK